MRIDSTYHAMFEMGFKVYPFRTDDDLQEIQDFRSIKEEDDELEMAMRLQKRIFKTDRGFLEENAKNF